MPELKVVSWNMGQNPDSWDYLLRLRDEQDVHLALVQEAQRPPHPDRWPAVTPDPADESQWKIAVPPRMSRRNYASAIVVLDEGLSLTPVAATPLADANYEDFAASHPGQFAVARVGWPGVDHDVVVVSLYGLWHEPSGNGAEATLHRAVSDLTPLLLAEPRIVLAGDLNLFRNTDNVGQTRFDTVFTRLAAYGLELHGPFRVPDGAAQEGCSCGQGERCDHVETYRHWHRNAKPYQDDYVFASESLKLKSCDAQIDAAVTDFSDRTQRLSDHWPVVATLDLA